MLSILTHIPGIKYELASASSMSVIELSIPVLEGHNSPLNGET